MTLTDLSDILDLSFWILLLVTTGMSSYYFKKSIPYIVFCVILGLFVTVVQTRQQVNDAIHYKAIITQIQTTQPTEK